MPVNQIVIKCKDGEVKKGSTNDFLPNKDTFHLNSIEGRIEEINVNDAKAIFFVKDLDGNRDYNYTYEDAIPGGGKKMSVDFEDGERIVGYALGYSPERKGFFMTPADLGGNNQRIYVVSSSVKNLEML